MKTNDSEIKIVDFIRSKRGIWLTANDVSEGSGIHYRCVLRYIGRMWADDHFLEIKRERISGAGCGNSSWVVCAKHEKRPSI